MSGVVGRDSESVDTWSFVIALMKQQVTARMRNPAKGEAWLQAVGAESRGRLLPASMAIDIMRGAISPTKIAAVLDRLVPNAETLHAFHAALLSEESMAHVSCLEPVRSREPASYARLVSLRTFIEQYLQAQFGLSSHDADDVAAARKLLEAPFSLGGIHAWWSGARGIVWVTSAKSIPLAGDAAERKRVVNGIVDALGIPATRETEYVLTWYPDTFAGLEHSFRPTCLDASWDGAHCFYLSGGEHLEWGKTQSCSGTSTGLPERIHKKVRLTDDYSCVYVGLARTLGLDYDAAAAEAMKRVRAVREAWRT